MNQPQANPNQVINILRIRLNEEIYQRTLLEAAYTKTTEQITQLTQQLDQLREQATNHHTQPSQQLETSEPFTHADCHAETQRLRNLTTEIINEVETWSRDPLDTDQLLADWRNRTQPETGQPSQRSQKN